MLRKSRRVAHHSRLLGRGTDWKSVGFPLTVSWKLRVGSDPRRIHGLNLFTNSLNPCPLLDSSRSDVCSFPRYLRDFHYCLPRLLLQASISEFGHFSSEFLGSFKSATLFLYQQNWWTINSSLLIFSRVTGITYSDFYVFVSIELLYAFSVP